MEDPKAKITVKVLVDAPIEQVWKFWTSPEAISGWNHASDEWHTPYVENNVRVGGTFLWRMEAKDGSFGFDFGGVYDTVNPNEQIQYTIGDGRKVKIDFRSLVRQTEVTETFEAESQHPLEMQRTGWQAILDNFKRYAEKNKV